MGPSTVRSRSAFFPALLLALSVAACGNSQEAFPAESVTLEAGSGVQPLSSVLPGAEDRVSPSLLATIPGFEQVSQGDEYTDDVASAVCGNKRGPQAYGSFSGMHREWRDRDVSVRQFVGVWGVITAARAIEQVGSMLDCGSYQDRDGAHSDVHRVSLPSATLAFCEVLNGARTVCTGMLARQDMLVRIQVDAVDEVAATEVLGLVVPKAAEVLNEAW